MRSPKWVQRWRFLCWRPCAAAARALCARRLASARLLRRAPFLRPLGRSSGAFGCIRFSLLLLLLSHRRPYSAAARPANSDQHVLLLAASSPRIRRSSAVPCFPLPDGHARSFCVGGLRHSRSPPHSPALAFCAWNASRAFAVWLGWCRPMAPANSFRRTERGNSFSEGVLGHF